MVSPGSASRLIVCQVVEKAYATEPVGVVCRVRGVTQVVEYSEIQPETAELRGPGGELVYSAGNICNHFFTRAFLQDAAASYKDQLKQHVALKKVPYLDASGRQVTPSTPNAIKMERFVFDVFPFSRNFVVFEVEREEEFSPLKNADGLTADGPTADSPTTARNALLAQHCRWVTAAHGTLLDEDGNPLPPRASASAVNKPPARCEISPLVSYSGEGLEELLRGRTLQTPLLLDEKRAKELQMNRAL